MDREGPAAWIPLDPDLTRAGARPSTYDPEGGLPTLAPEAAAPRRRWPWLAAAVVALGVGVAGGYGVREWAVTRATLSDATGSLSVEVPESWAASVQGDPWTPPEQELSFPALAVGTDAGWQDGDGRGVFVALLPGNDLPEQVPQHPECADQRPPVTDDEDGDLSVTVLFTGCEADGSSDGVTVERVVRVTSDQLLWVQVRAGEQGTANRVLDSVETSGL